MTCTLLRPPRAWEHGLGAVGHSDEAAKELSNVSEPDAGHHHTRIAVFLDMAECKRTVARIKPRAIVNLMGCRGDDSLDLGAGNFGASGIGA